MGKGNSKIAPMTAINELICRTDFTHSDLLQLFKEFHKDFPMGYMTKKEFKKCYQTIFPQGNPEPLADHVFRVLDKNKDDKLDFREFMCRFNIAKRGTAEEKLAFAFSIYDLNDDGYMTKNELLEITKAIYNTVETFTTPETFPNEESIAGMIFEEMDKNMDGFVTKEEFVSTALKNSPMKNFLDGPFNFAD